MKASGRLVSMEQKLTSAFTEVKEKVEGQIPLPDIDVVLVDNPDNVIPEIGVGGFAINANLIYININPDSAHFQANLHKEIVSTLTHELHHCARLHTIGYGKTLLEAMISEGLADHFDIELNNHEPNPWSIAIMDAQSVELREKAIPEFDNASYDHIAWFFGSEERGIPRWTGYSVGFTMVGEYMKKTGKSAAELYMTPAKLFL